VIGGAIFAVWNASPHYAVDIDEKSENVDHAFQAVDCALTMHDVLDTLRPDWLLAGLPRHRYSSWLRKNS
tara:strand:+ start:111 stop:320 length:210 start_codon:yes stop_codon:yes gene_type:complete